VGQSAERYLKGDPVEQHDPDAAAEKPLDRRSVVTAAAAAVTGAALTKLAAADDAQASHNTNIAYDSQTVVHTDVTNTGAGSTRISSNISGTAAFVALNDYPVGISRPDGLLGRTSYTTSNAAGVAGSNESASGGIGVLGASFAADGVGVYGNAGSVVPSQVGPPGTGVYGRGPNRGVSGESVDGVGVQGVSTGSGRAALFVGKTRVEGVLEAVGKVPATVIEGRRTYATAALAPSFEQVGQARLRNGRATVKLPPAFDALVPSSSYQVFLTEYGDLGGLYISSRRLHAFDVRSRRSGANGLFGWRVVVVRPGLKNA
jgi:hypothetical protein